MELSDAKKNQVRVSEQIAKNNALTEQYLTQKPALQEDSLNPGTNTKASSTVIPTARPKGLLPKKWMKLSLKDLQMRQPQATENMHNSVFASQPSLSLKSSPPQKTQETLLHNSKQAESNEYLHSNSAIPSGHHKTHTISIAIRLRKITQLFNSFDPSPFLEKDLDEDAFEYIYSSVAEHHLNTKLKLVIHIPVHQKKKISEEDVKIAIKNFFEYKAILAERNISLELKEGQLSFIVGIIFLGSCLLLANFISGLHDSLVVNIIVEGLVIGGWVAMWKPISNILYDWWPLHKEKKIYHKISRMEADFVYE